MTMPSPQNRPAVIGLVEPSANLARLYGETLSNNRYEVRTYTTQPDFTAAQRDAVPDLMVIDIKQDDMRDPAIFQKIREWCACCPVIITSHYGSIRGAVEAVRHGAIDFLVKPFDTEKLIDAVTKALSHIEQGDTLTADLAGMNPPTATRKSSLTPLRPPVHAPSNAPDTTPQAGFIGTSPAMQQIYERIEHAASSRATVFITGESGTGKEVCAEAIHKLSPRANAPFIPINCAAIPRDLMESELFGHVKGAFTGAISDREGAASLADGGTLFLDEIAEMNPDMQTKLLRFLQNLTFTKIGGSRMEKTDVRIICATNRTPQDEIAAGNFREDLYYRLHVLPIHMPPLRERGEDVIDLAQTFLRRFAEEEGKDFRTFSLAAETLIRRYTWPGNIRQLQNVLRHIVVMGKNATTITPDMLPAELHESTEQRPFSVISTPEKTISSPPIGDLTAHTIRTLEQVERDTIEQALQLFAGNIPRAAAALGISPSTLYRKKAQWDSAAP